MLAEHRLMKKPVITLAALTYLLAAVGQAQQSPSPAQPQQTQTPSAPCAAPAQPPQPPKGWHFNLPKGLQQAIDKQRQQIQNQTGITIPSTQDLANQAKQAITPCGTASTPTPKAAPTPTLPPAPTPQVPAKTTAAPIAPFEVPTSVYGFACPVGTKLHVIPGYAYCDGPNDKSTPAILLTGGMPIPAGYFAQTASEAIATNPAAK